MASAAVAAAVLLQACSVSGNTTPRPGTVEPSQGFTARPTRVVIRGEDFLVRPCQAASGGAPAVDSAFRAWLGSQQLEEVAWIDAQTIHATVPAGLAAGPYSLVVEGPFGRQGQLGSAFTVLADPPGSLMVTVGATHTVVSVGQAIPVDATVTNSGSGEVVGVAPDATAPSGVEVLLASGPVPASIPSLAPGAQGVFSWTFVAAAAGTLTFGASVTGTDVLSGSTLGAASATAAQVAVQRPAALGATLSAPPAVALGIPFEVSMVVTNAGEAAAVEVAPGPLALAPGSVPAAVESGPSPSSATIPGGEAQTFIWRYRAGDGLGVLGLTGGAAGMDGNGGWPVASSTAATGKVTVGRAGLLGSLSVAPTIVAVGGTLLLHLEVANPGSAPAVGIVPGVPAVDGTALLDPVVVGPVPATIPSLTPGSSASFAWSFTARRPGSLGFAVTATGTDAISGGSLITTASLRNAVTVSGAALAVTRFAASPSPGMVGVPVTLTLDLTNTGSDAATVGAITPSASPASGASCGSPAPATPLPLAAGGTATFTWTCTATAAGSYLLGASVIGSATGTTLDLDVAVAPLTVAVSSPTALAVASFTLGRSTANVGQPIAATLQLSNPSATSSTVTAVSPASTPTTSMTCTAAAPAPPRTIASGATFTFTWNCTAAAAGSFVLGGGVVARDAASGADMSPTLTGNPVLVQVPASLTVTTFAASPATISVGASTTVTLVLRNGGGASVSVAGVTPSISPSNRGTCTAAAPALPQVIGGGASLTFTWTCTGTQARTFTLDGTVAATDVNSGASLAPDLPAQSLVVR